MALAVFVALMMFAAVSVCRGEQGSFSQVVLNIVRVGQEDMLDIALLAEALGIERLSNPLGRKVVLTKGGRFLILFVGSNRVALRKGIVRLSASPCIVDGAVLVPVDFIERALSEIVDFPVGYKVVGRRVAIFDRNIGMRPLGRSVPNGFSQMSHLKQDTDQDGEEAESATGFWSEKRPARFRDSVLDVVVIDPGHGGGDTGGCGPTGLLEKEVTLKLAMRIKRLLTRRLRVKVFLTRESDGPVSLERRTAVANNQKADLFISLHANSSFDRDKSGLAVFAASIDPSGPDAARTVSAENKVIRLEPGGSSQSPEEYARMLWELAQNEYFAESITFGRMLVSACRRERIHLASPLPQHGPFIVLIGASMPAVLLEIGYLSNPADEQLLKSDGYLDRLAGAVCDAVKELKGYISRPRAVRQ